MNENVVFGLFLFLPLLFAYLLYLFFRKFKQHRTGSVLKLAVGNLLVLLFVLSLILLSGEAYYRFFYDTTDGFGLAKTTKRWFQRHFHVNHSGYRDSIEYRLKIPDGKRRLTFLGDSFTVGQGVPNVEDRFANKIRGMRDDCEVHVLARCGWNTGHELVLLRTMPGTGYEFDVVVLVYCINDVGDFNPTWRQTVAELQDETNRGLLVPHSYFLSLLRCRFKTATDSDLADYLQFIRASYEGPIWESQKRRLRQLRDDVRARGARLLVVTFPFLQSLGPDYEFADAHARLADFWRELDVPHLDLLDIFQGFEPNELVVNRHDRHPNEMAHALAAAKINTFLDEVLDEAAPQTRTDTP